MVLELLREARLDLFEVSVFNDRQSNGLGGYFLECIFEDLGRLDENAWHPRNTTIAAVADDVGLSRP